MSHNEMTLTPLVGAFGVEVEGVQLTDPLDEAGTHAIREAVLRHQLLVFRNQGGLTPERLKSFGSLFGTLDVHPYIKSLPDYPEVIGVIKEPQERANFGGGWHAEVSFYEQPAMGTILYAREVPSNGGDTLVANMILAYEALSPVMREMLDGLVAIHSAERVYAPGGAYEGRANAASTGVNTTEAANKRVEHPVVRTHPETDQKLLYVDRAFTLHVKGLRAEESRMLLDYLCDHVTKTEFCTRVQWHRDTLAFWDNRCTQHYALNDYPGERREMHRVVIEGDRPY